MEQKNSLLVCIRMGFLIKIIWVDNGNKLLNYEYSADKPEEF